MRIALALILSIATSVSAQDVLLQEGDVISFAEIEKLRSHLPPEFWEHREFFFREDMRVKIGRDRVADETPVACAREAEEEVAEPLDARGSIVVTYRSTADGSEAASGHETPDDTWVFLPGRRSVRQLPTEQSEQLETGSLALGELRSFNAIPPGSPTSCADSVRVLAPAKASGEWELRDAWLIRFDLDPYGHEDVYVDQTSFEALYSFSYDRTQELWKITWHDPREDSAVTIDVQARRKLIDLER